MITPLLTEIDAFLTRTGMAESTFGQKAVHEWRLVPRLREGGDVTTRTADRIREFMRDWEPAERRARSRGRAAA